MYRYILTGKKNRCTGTYQQVKYRCTGIYQQVKYRCTGIYQQVKCRCTGTYQQIKPGVQVYRGCYLQIKTGVKVPVHRKYIHVKTGVQMYQYLLTGKKINRVGTCLQVKFRMTGTYLQVKLRWTHIYLQVKYMCTGIYLQVRLPCTFTGNGQNVCRFKRRNFVLHTRKSFPWVFYRPFCPLGTSWWSWICMSTEE